METSGAEMRINGVLGRLEEIIEKENQSIGSDAAFDIKASSAQKSRCLYELNLLSRTLQQADVTPMFARRLGELRKSLETNSIRVKAHLEAVRGVTDLINETARAAEADGTYSAEQFRMQPGVHGK